MVFPERREGEEKKERGGKGGGGEREGRGEGKRGEWLFLNARRLNQQTHSWTDRISSSVASLDYTNTRSRHKPQTVNHNSDKLPRLTTDLTSLVHCSPEWPGTCPCTPCYTGPPRFDWFCSGVPDARDPSRYDVPSSGDHTPNPPP